MPQLDNYEVWIQVDGNKLPEYGMHYSGADQSEITCWIPSEVGKAFEICYKDSVRAFETGPQVFVDGNLCPGRILYSRQARPLQHDVIKLNGVPTSNDSYRPFVFSNCQLTDDDEFVSSSTNPGQITIHVKQLAVGGYKDASTFCSSYKPLPQLKIHERSKKGLVHGIQLGPECIDQQKARHTTTIRHLVTFKFNYRPLDVLRADGIVPRPAPGNDKVTLDSNDEEARIQALKEELRALEARQHQKKRKRSNSNTGIAVQRVKRERSFTIDNHVIDLT